MNRYTIDCTPEQTCKALELGAPIKMTLLEGNQLQPIQPTAEQMIGWLEDQGNHLLLVDITETSMGIWSFRLLYKRNKILGFDEDNRGYHSRKEATLAAIDATLDYLSKNDTKSLR